MTAFVVVMTILALVSIGVSVVDGDGWGIIINLVFGIWGITALVSGMLTPYVVVMAVLCLIKAGAEGGLGAVISFCLGLWGVLAVAL